MAGAFLVVVGFIAVKIRNNKRKRQMEEEETAAREIEKEKGKGTAKLTIDNVVDDLEENNS
jgi:hypothetical protein